MYLFEILETRENLSIIDYFKKLLGRLPKEAFFNNKNHFDDPTARPGVDSLSILAENSPVERVALFGQRATLKKIFQLLGWRVRDQLGRRGGTCVGATWPITSPRSALAVAGALPSIHSLNF